MSSIEAPTERSLLAACSAVLSIQHSEGVLASYSYRSVECAKFVSRVERVFLTSSRGTSLSTASGAEKLLLVFVGLCSFVFAQATALQPRDPYFVSKKEDRRC